jgi:uncharacterized iron-regulated protein
MRKLIHSFLFLLTFHAVQAQHPVYELLNSEGKVIEYKQLLDELKNADVVFLGEFHDQPLSHWIQVALIKDLFGIHGANLKVGAEMFERDNQIIIDDYFTGIITQKKFEEETRLWKNYKSDYKTVFEFCKTNNISFYATNAPGRYVNAVYNQGIDVFNKLSPEALQYLPTQPVHFNMEVACYSKMIKEMGGHGGDKIAYAQALRDASMAEIIEKNHQPGTKFLHLNGTYHSDYHEGIVYYLKRTKPNLKILVLSTIYEANPKILSEDNRGKADFYLSIHNDMTRSY